MVFVAPHSAALLHDQLSLLSSPPLAPRALLQSYGQDGRLKEYADSAAQLARSEEKVRLQQLQIRQRQAALGQFGEQASARARSNHMSPSLRAQVSRRAARAPAPALLQRCVAAPRWRLSALYLLTHRGLIEWAPNRGH